MTDVALALESATRRRPRTRGGSSRAARLVGPLVVLAILVGLWYLWAKKEADKGLGFLVPYPHVVWRDGFGDPTVRSELWPGLGHTCEVAFTGLAISIVIGVVWATAMAQAKWAENALFPYAVVLQCIPILAISGLLGAIFNYGFNVRVVVTVMISLFPLVSNTLFGLQSVDKGQRELFQLQGASRWTVLTKLQFPAALPSIFVGLRTAAGLSVIGSIVGDQLFQRGTPGLGVLINTAQSRLNGGETWAAILTASALGVVVFLVFGLLGRLAVGRWHNFG
jgi:NitT/TauT family transport system permease protein